MALLSTLKTCACPIPNRLMLFLSFAAIMKACQVYEKHLPRISSSTLKHKIDSSLMGPPQPKPSARPDDCKIPHRLFQTTQFTTFPDLVGSHLTDFSHHIFNDDQARKFIANEYPTFLDAFDTFQGAHKADLWRYLILHHYGGVYLDIKTRVIAPLNVTFQQPRSLYAVLGSTRGILHPHMHNGVLASCRSSPILLELADHMKLAAVNYSTDLWDYPRFVQHMYFVIHDKFTSHGQLANRVLHNSIFSVDKSTADVMMELCDDEICQIQGGRDRYNLCCGIFQGRELRFLERDPTYPNLPNWRL